MSRLSDHTRSTLARASQLAVATSERIQRSLALLEPHQPHGGSGLCGTPENAAGASRKVARSARRSAPPPAGA